MNKRIAKKILLCRSNLCADKDRVLSARRVYRANPDWFKSQGIYLTYPFKGEQTVINHLIESPTLLKSVTEIFGEGVVAKAYIEVIRSNIDTCEVPLSWHKNLELRTTAKDEVNIAFNARCIRLVLTNGNHIAFSSSSIAMLSKITNRSNDATYDFDTYYGKQT